MSSVEQLIQRQIAFFEARRRREKEDSSSNSARSHFGPYVLISRENGAGGSLLAKLLGEKLGWQVYNRDLVEAVAAHAQVRRDLVESLDERRRSLVTAIIAAGVDHQDLGESAYQRHLREVLGTLGQHGQVVIVGRGAHYFLPREYGLSMRLIAPLEVRSARVAGQQGCSVLEARSRIQNLDHQRAAFIRQHFNQAVANPLDYDLVLNTAALSPEDEVQIALAAVHVKLHLAVEKR